MCVCGWMWSYTLSVHCTLYNKGCFVKFYLYIALYYSLFGHLYIGTWRLSEAIYSDVYCRITIRIYAIKQMYITWRRLFTLYIYRNNISIIYINTVRIVMVL